MEVWGGLFHPSSNFSRLLSTTVTNSRKGSYLLGRVTARIMWVLSIIVIFFVYFANYHWLVIFRIVCGFITGWCFNLLFPICQLTNWTTWKDVMQMGLFTFHSDIRIGKNSYKSWMRVARVFTFNLMDKFQSLDWFGWVNVLFPIFRNVIFLCVIILGASNPNSNIFGYITVVSCVIFC